MILKRILFLITYWCRSCLLFAYWLVDATAARSERKHRVYASWQTTPILGTSTGYDGNVLVYTDSGVATIPHVSIPGDPLNGIGLPSMTLFHVGQTVDAGSGIYYGCLLY